MKSIFACLLGLIAGVAQANAAVHVINGDALYPEGPVWYHGKLYYIEYARNTVTVWDGRRNSVFASLAGCGPSAVVPTHHGEFLVTCADNNSIGRLTADGKSLPPYAHDKDGNAFISPNDFAPDADGGIYFTTSGNHNSIADATRPADVPIVEGQLFYIAVDGTITRKATDLHSANGLAVSQDGKTLYLVETDEHRLMQFTIGADGSLTDQRVFVNLDDLTHHVVHIWPDGVKIDTRGNLYIGQSAQLQHAPLAGTIFVVDASAKLQRTLVVPSLQVPNLAFSPDEKTVYVTAVDQIDQAPYHGKVYSITNP